jgi:hypothetical protein
MRRNIKLQRLLLACSTACLVLVAALGCGPGDGRVRVYPASGKVLVRGQPADGAVVTLYPTTPELQEAKVPPPTGTADGNGEFRLSTYGADDGAPAGEYQVTIVWPEARPENYVGIFEPRDQLRGQYATPNSSKLTANLESGGGELPPFELQ